jgi:hypothetical protein
MFCRKMGHASCSRLSVRKEGEAAGPSGVVLGLTTLVPPSLAFFPEVRPGESCAKRHDLDVSLKAYTLRTLAGVRPGVIGSSLRFTVSRMQRDGVQVTRY